MDTLLFWEESQAVAAALGANSLCLIGVIRRRILITAVQTL